MIVTTYFKVISILTPSMTISTARQTHSKLFLSLSGECESWVELSWVLFHFRAWATKETFLKVNNLRFCQFFHLFLNLLSKSNRTNDQQKLKTILFIFWDIFKRDASDGSKFCQRNDLKINFFLIKNPTTSHTYPTVWPDGTIMFSILVIFQHINCA